MGWPTKEAQRAYEKAWREKNRDKLRAQHKAWSEANRDKKLAATLRYQARHPEKTIATRRATYANHKESLLEKSNLWKAQHPERVKAWDKARRERLKNDPVAHERRKENYRNSYRLRRDKIIANVKAYREKNWNKILEWSRISALRRRARLANAAGTFTQEQWQARYDYYGGRCAYCRCELAINEAHIDHVIPVSKGGANWPSNLVPACESCNKSKQTKLWKPSAFVQTMPRQVTKTS